MLLFAVTFTLRKKYNNFKYYPLIWLSYIKNTSRRWHALHRLHDVNKITIDCQKGGPPITASKCTIIMKICTSVTSILIRYKKPKKQNYSKHNFKLISCKQSSIPLSCTTEDKFQIWSKGGKGGIKILLWTKSHKI